MISESKRLLRANVRTLLERQGGTLKPKESGVTRLVNLGIANGNAQRILDEDSDLRLSTIDLLADKLKVSIGELMSPATAEASSLPFRDLNSFEAQLVTFFRQLSDDAQHNLLVELNRRTATAQTPSVADPWAGTRNRRFGDVEHVPDRREPKVVRR